MGRLLPEQLGSPLPRVPDRREPFPGAERWVTARFTPDGLRLFAVYDNGHAVRWELDPAAWRRYGCTSQAADSRGMSGRASWPEQDYRQTCP